MFEKPPTPAPAFRRDDDEPDEQFYRDARLVTHIDEGAIDAVTDLYREMFPAGGDILDLMSSWVSHLPSEIDYRTVTGLGMNRDELENNPRLNAHVVQDLNREPRLPFADEAFDGAAVCVSIQYLVRPVEVLGEVWRVLRPRAPLVITYSNRCFPTKAVAVWQSLDHLGQAGLIEEYLRAAGAWQQIHTLDRSPSRKTDPLYAVVGIKSAGANG